MEYKAILKDLKKGEVHPVYFLYGDESYYIDEIINYLENKFLPEKERAFNQSVFYGKDADPQAILDTARRLPVMAEKQLVLVKEAQDMRGFNDLQRYFEKPVPSTVMAISYKDKKLDGRSKIAKTLKEKAVMMESKKIYDNQIPQWVIRYLKEASYSITPEAAMLVAEHLGRDLSKISNELDKLILNLSSGSTVDKVQIARHIGISKDYNIFEFQKALGLKDKEKAYQIQQYFSANSKSHSIIMILASLYNYFSKIYMIHFLGKMPDRQLVQRLRLPSPYFLKEYKTSARNYSRIKTEEVLGILREYDLKSKGVHNISTPPSELLKEMVYRIMQ